MQQIASSRQPNPNGRGSSRSVIIAILALLLFALSGLLTGFATGAFTRSKQTAQQNTTTNNNGNKSSSSGNTSVPPIQTPTPHVTQTPDINVVGLGCPDVQYYIPQEVGGSSYKFQTQITDKSAQCTNNGGGKPLHVVGVTCRLWLTKDNHFNDNIPKDRLKSVDTLNDPFPKEKGDALSFSSTTLKVQPCNAQGATSWQYQLSPSLDKGTYYLVVLATWKGLYNWTARQITVTKAD